MMPDGNREDPRPKTNIEPKPVTESEVKLTLDAKLMPEHKIEITLEDKTQSTDKVILELGFCRSLVEEHPEMLNLISSNFLSALFNA